MEAKILNFPDAMKLAKLLIDSGYESNSNISLSISNWIEKVHHIPHLEVILLLSGKSKQEIQKMTGEDVLVLLLAGFLGNRVNELLGFVERAGM